MKKILAICLSLAFFNVSFAGEPNQGLNTGRAISYLVLGSGVIWGINQLEQYMLPALHGTALVASTMLGAGIAAGKPELKSLAVKTFLAGSATYLTAHPTVIAMAHQVPLGIGDAFKKAGEATTASLVAIAAYMHVLNPIAEAMLSTKGGQFLMKL